MDEVILKKGSKIIGAFHDPNMRKNFIGSGSITYREKEYSMFLEKIKKLGLDLIEINARFK